MKTKQAKKKVLVVDDERDIVDLIRCNLNKEGCEVIGAHNGQEALIETAKGVGYRFRE
jgi:DNA-binding response OmpR family regulator